MQSCVVPADDGVALATWCEGPVDAPVTVVMTHGYAQAHGCWHHQVPMLAAAGLRVVVWDLREHGRSGRGAEQHCTIAQLADDLARVVDVHAPSGPLVLVGHSMGGMTMMALAERHPELVGRIAGLAFVSTSVEGDDLGHLGLGERAAPVVQHLARHLFALLSHTRLVWPLLWCSPRLLDAMMHHFCCGGHSSRADDHLTAEMARQAGFATMARFVPTLQAHRRAGALAALAGIPALVLTGDSDLVIPPESTERIAGMLPGARQVVVEGAGHNVMMAAPRLVGEELLALAERSCRRHLANSGRMER